jgi:two-component system, OmpR family, response regulator MprA
VLNRPVLTELISLSLNHGVCSVRTATAPEHSAPITAEWQPHLLILDMALNCPQIIQQFRTQAVAGSTPSVMSLVEPDDLQSKLAVFNAGADDMLVVPFAPEELLARVLALTRRSTTGPVQLTSTITIGELEIDIVNRTVRADDLQLRLTPLEFGLLYLLLANPGQVLTRAQILHVLLGTDHKAEGKVVDQYVRSLRARLQTLGRPAGCIATVAGRGYRFSRWVNPSHRSQGPGADPASRLHTTQTGSSDADFIQSPREDSHRVVLE